MNNEYFLIVYAKKHRYLIIAAAVAIALLSDVFGFIEDNREYVDLNLLLADQYLNVQKNTEISNIERSDLKDVFEKDLDGKYIFYTGIVKNISSRWRGGYEIDIKPTFGYLDISCISYSKESVYASRVNQSISIRGYVDRVFLDYTIDECDIMSYNTKDNIRE